MMILRLLPKRWLPSPNKNFPVLIKSQFALVVLERLSQKSTLAMSSIQMLNPGADVARQAQALQMTVNAARGLQNVIKTNLGPKGTLKMY